MVFLHLETLARENAAGDDDLHWLGRRDRDPCGALMR
jgi:hypothetical protein